MSDFKENIEKLNVRAIVLSSVMTAFGLVVALVWKDTIIATVTGIVIISIIQNGRQVFAFDSLKMLIMFDNKS